MASEESKDLKDIKDSKGYLSSLSSFTPWSSRSGTPKPTPRDADNKGSYLSNKQQKAVDHSVSHRHRLSLRDYPKDCPSLTVQWFHAIDIPKRKPKISHADPTPKTEKPAAQPKKYSPFSAGDSRAIEAAFQRLAEEEEDKEKQKLIRDSEESAQENERSKTKEKKHHERRHTNHNSGTKVAVNEDYLFDVDIEARELLPAYWLGPTYDVRRGTWFFVEGSALRPCEENLATQLEEGYLKIRPWTLPLPPMTRNQRSNSQAKVKPQPQNAKTTENESSPLGQTSRALTSKSSSDSLKESSADGLVTDPTPMKAFRLFGSYMNSVVTYQDATTAWLVNDDFLMKMSSTLYERFAGGGHFAGMKVVRGYIDPNKRAEATDGKNTLDSGSSKQLSSSAPETQAEPKVQVTDESDDHESSRISASETRRRDLQRQMSSLVDSVAVEDKDMQDEEVRRRNEKEIRDDYQDRDDDEQGREIEHLILVTHGIGQRLGLRMESVNFVHDVNTLRKTLKAVYSESPDLQALNNEVDSTVKNSKVQVLPICWRHLLDFPKQSIKHNRKEHDLGDADFSDEQYPSLADITIEGVPAVRNLITDLGMDILLYQSPAYKDHITKIVLEECNRTYKLFKERNPNFSGKVSLIGHSLGSAVMFDILCQEQLDTGHKGGSAKQMAKDRALAFEVEDFYALGSPVGMFQMLKGCTIAARQDRMEMVRSLMDGAEEPFMSTQAGGSSKSARALNYVEITTSSPKCAQVFNIFHPADPIAYRLEPLISPAMAALKPQALPYTKKGIFTAPVGQGLTGIGSRVGQSVSGIWSSFSTGVATSLLNRSLGISNVNVSRLGQGGVAGQVTSSQTAQQSQAGNLQRASSLKGPKSASTGTKDKSITTTDKDPGATTVAGTSGNEENLEHPHTLIQEDIETLSSGFEKKRRASQGSEHDHQEARRELEEQARRLKREERKVRALNTNGRVDYSIQEGAFDISVLAAIASHLAYWSDEDVCHFMMSQLLSRQRLVKRSDSTKGHHGAAAIVKAESLGHRRSVSVPIAR